MIAGTTYEALASLLADYAYARDTRDTDGAVVCFAEDAEAFGLAGQADLRRFFERVHKVQVADRRHVFTNLALTADDGDTATMRAYETLYTIADGKISLAVTGTVELRARRTAGGWRIQGMTLDLDVPYAPEDLAGVFPLDD